MSLTQYQYSFEASPITLVNGIAQNMPGSIMPILQLFDPDLYTSSGSLTIASFDDVFARFRPSAGSTLIDNDIGHYPFANQAIAANAIIANPLRVSLKMYCPATNRNTFDVKSAKMQNLQYQLYAHNSLGGTYVVNTPSFPYVSCILIALRDITGEGEDQAQVMWQWDFEQPQVTLQQAGAAQIRMSQLMQTISNGVKVNPDTTGTVPYSGPQNASGQPSSGAGLALIPGVGGSASATQNVPGVGGGSDPAVGMNQSALFMNGL